MLWRRSHSALRVIAAPARWTLPVAGTVPDHRAFITSSACAHSPTGFVARLGRLRLIQLRLKRPRIDLRQQVALLDVLALDEIDRLQLAIDAHVNRNAIERLDGAEAGQVDRHVLRARARDRDRDGRRGGGYRRLGLLAGLIPKSGGAESDNERKSRSVFINGA